MASSIGVISGLEWVVYDNRAPVLLARTVCDFDVYDGYDVSPFGMYGNNQTRATGVVVDNLDGERFVTISVGPLVERVPPFTRQTLILPSASPPFRVTGRAGQVSLAFFFGAYPGAQNGVNLFAAFANANS